MNQGLIFTGLYVWEPQLDRIRFNAQLQGALIPCLISVATLSKLEGRPVHGEQESMLAFEAHRFEIEQQAEALIEDEAFTDEGAVLLDQAF